MTELMKGPGGLEPRIGKNGKRLWSKAQKRFIVSETTKPGASVSKVSRQYDINANLIFRWMRAAGLDIDHKQRIVPVGIIGVPSAFGARPGASAPKPIEIELSNGTKVRIDDEVRMPLLKSVLEMLRGLA